MLRNIGKIKFMNKKILTLLFIFILFSSSIYAQKGGAYIGKLDVRTVFLLHPSMIDYSPEKNAFKVTRNAESKKSVESEASSNQEELDKLNALLKSLAEKIMEEEKNYYKKIDFLNQKYLDNIAQLATGEASVNQMTYNMEAGNAEASHNAKLTALYAQYSSIEEKIMKLSQFEYNDDYTTPDETEKKFVTILNEIKTYTQRIAGQKGISVVINTSYKRTMTATDSNNSSTGYVSDSMALGAIFNNKFPSELLKDEAAVSGYYTNLSSLTQNWLRNSDPIIGRLKNSMLENDIFIGGVDLTPEVLSALFKAYKLDPNISNAVIKSALSY